MESTTDTPSSLEGSCQPTNGEKRAFHRVCNNTFRFLSIPFLSRRTTSDAARFRNQFFAAMIGNVRINEILDGRLATGSSARAAFRSGRRLTDVVYKRMEFHLYRLRSLFSPLSFNRVCFSRAFFSTDFDSVGKSGYLWVLKRIRLVSRLYLCLVVFLGEQFLQVWCTGCPRSHAPFFWNINFNNQNKKTDNCFNIETDWHIWFWHI